MHRRLPKLRGFKNFKRVEYQAVNLSQLEKLGESKVDKEMLVKAGLIRKASTPAKLLGSGELKKKIDIEIEKASQSAIKKVEQAGGKVTLLIKKEEQSTPEKKVAAKAKADKESKDNKEATPPAVKKEKEDSKKKEGAKK